MADCIFCKIVEKEIPATVVYEDSKVMAFLDVNPANKGHTLVIPKNHYETLGEVPDPTLAEISIVCKKVSKAVLKAVETTDFNIVQSNGEISGQVVPHVHFHIIPRFKNDGLTLGRLNRAPYSYGENEAKEVANSIRQAMME